MYTTVGAIAAAERVYYMQFGSYAGTGDLMVWTDPADPTNLGNIAFRNILGVDVYPNANSDFSYLVWNSPTGIIHVRRNSTRYGLCYYACSTKTWYTYSIPFADDWQKYITIPLLD